MKIRQNDSIEQTLAVLLEAADQKAGESLPLLDAVGRRCYHNIYAPMAQPPFDRSPLDGYAVISRDILHASEAAPVRLRILETIHAGDFPTKTLTPGTTARIMTGSPLPTGATCVVRQEDTRSDGLMVDVFKSHGEYENYCFRGEDMQKGQLLLTRGDPLNAAAIGILAGQGMAEASVFEQPKIGILSTGSELTLPGIPLRPGKIYNGNYDLLAARAMEAGARVVATDRTQVADDPDVIAAALDDILSRSDLVVTSGGASVGAHDYMKEVGLRLGAHLLFQGVAAKPGGVVMGWRRGGKTILNLSGNPFGAYAMFELLAVPILRRMAGAQQPCHRRARGIAQGSFDKPSRGRRFLRARFEDGEVFLAAGHSSGTLYPLIHCNCFIDVAAGTPSIAPGDSVEVILFAT
jgi:molybdopterin molybdotransferase